MSIADTDALARATQIAWVASDDRAVLLKLDDLGGPPITLEGTAGAVWEAIGTAPTVKRLADLLSARYDLTAEEIAGSIRPFVSECVEQGLLVVEANDSGRSG